METGSYFGGSPSPDPAGRDDAFNVGGSMAPGASAAESTARGPSLLDNGALNSASIYQLTSSELETLLCLYQSISAMQKLYSTGQQTLEIPALVQVLLVRLRFLHAALSPADKKRYPSQLWQLIAICSRVQSVCIMGRSAEVAAREASAATAAGAAGREASTATTTRGSMPAGGAVSPSPAPAQPTPQQMLPSYDIDCSTFADLRSLKICDMTVKSIYSVSFVVEVHLQGVQFLPSFGSFGSLRSLHLERSNVVPKDLVPLSFSLRSLIVTQFPNEPQLPMFQLPSAEDVEEAKGLLPWESLTHVSFSGCRLHMHRLDVSWDKVTNLTSLTLSKLGLKQLSHLQVIQRCIHLLALDLSHNKLSSLEFIGGLVPSIMKLDVSYNMLDSLQGVPNLTKLRTLNFTCNDVTEWPELKDVAFGCPNLAVLLCKHNPLLNRMNPETDLFPFTASIFNFRQLVVDGHKTHPYKSKVNAEFLSKYIHLFERNRGGGGDDTSSNAGSDGRRHSKRHHGGHKGGRERTRSSHARGDNEVASTVGSTVDRESNHGGARRKKKYPGGRLAPGAIMLDKMSAEIQLPDDKDAPQAAGADGNLAYDHKKIVMQLQEKYGDKWLDYLSVQTAALKYMKQGTEGAQGGAGQPGADGDPNAAENAAIAAAAAAYKEKLKQANEKRKAKKEREKRREEERSYKNIEQRAEITDSPEPEDPESPTVPLSNASTNASMRKSASGGDGSFVPRGRESQLSFSRAGGSSAAGGGGSGGPRAAPNKNPRQEPRHPPTPLFQLFLENLKTQDWVTYEASTATKIKVFPSGMQVFLSAICAENQALWECTEDDEDIEVHQNACEVLIHDARDNTHTYQNRFHNKCFVRVVEFQSGYTRYIRVESKTTGKFADKKPLMTIMFEATVPTATLDVQVEAVQLDAKGGGGGGGTRGSTSERQLSGFEEAGGNVDVTKAARRVFKLAKPRVIAAFLTSQGAGPILLQLLRKQMMACHARLCMLGITREWPLHIDDAGARQKRNRSVPVNNSVQYIKETLDGHTHDDISRQRLGCNVILQGDDMTMMLKSYIMTGNSKNDKFVFITYANQVVDDGTEEEERAVLLVITQKKMLVAVDNNYALPGAQQQGGDGKDGRDAARTDNIFCEAERHPLTLITAVEVSFNLQTIRVEIAGGEAEYILQLRDMAATMSILCALQAANCVDFDVMECPYAGLTTAPLIFSTCLFMKPVPGTKMATGKGKNTLAFPLRHICKVVDMVPVTLVILANDLVILEESNVMQGLHNAEVMVRRPFSTLSKFLVADSSLHPLIFGLLLENAQEKGIKKEKWVFAAQSPNTIANVLAEIRHSKDGIEVADLD